MLNNKEKKELFNIICWYIYSKIINVIFYVTDSNSLTAKPTVMTLRTSERLTITVKV